MAIDDLYQAGTDKVLDDRVARPLAERPPATSFAASTWGVIKAPFTGTAAGATEAAGFWSDTLGAFGTMQAAYGAQSDPTLLFDPAAAEQRRAEGAPARERIQTGEAFSSETGTQLRATAASFAPNAETASTAEQLLFGLTRFATKAVGYSLTAGPVPGAVIAGADEGTAEAERLKLQGVDIKTRTAAGAAMGVATGAAVALPIAGTTALRTAGLVAVGGPGGFIAQQAASKSILQNAGYDQIADQYNPFDPVGLAVSTLIPAGFGAYAARGIRARGPAPTGQAPRDLGSMAGNEKLALKYDDPRLDAYAVTAAQREGIPPEALLAIKNVGEKSNPTAVSPKDAKGVMQFIPDTWAAYGKGDPRDPVASIDAGARLMKDLIKQYDGNVRAAIAHYNGGNKAGKAVMEGRTPPAAETSRYLERTDNYLAERAGTEAGRAAAADPDAVAAARVQQVRDSVEASNLYRPDDMHGSSDHLDAVLRASDQISAGQRVDVGDSVRLDDLSPVAESKAFRDWFADSKVMDSAGNPVKVFHGTNTDFSAFSNEKIGNRTGNKTATGGHFFSSNPEIAAIFAGEGKAVFEGANVRPAYLSMRAPLDLPAARFRDEFVRGDGNFEAYIAATKAEGYDGIRIVGDEKLSADKYSKEYTADSWIAFEPAQIKSAIGASAKFNDFRAGVDSLSGAKPVDMAESAPAAQKPAPAVVDPAAGEPGAAPAANPAAGHADAQAAEISALSPDMMVQLEGMGAPMRLADALEAVKAEAAREAADAPLLQVAANCFLRNS